MNEYFLILDGKEFIHGPLLAGPYLDRESAFDEAVLMAHVHAADKYDVYAYGTRYVAIANDDEGHVRWWHVRKAAPASPTPKGVCEFWDLV